MTTVWMRDRWGRAAYGVLTAVLAAYVLVVFIHGSGINSFGPAKVVDMIYGRAHRPFVYRTLVPSLVRLGAAVIPSRAKQAISDAARPSALAHVGWEQAYATEYVLLLMLMGASLVGFILATRYLFDGLFEASPVLGAATSLVAAACLPAFLAPYGRYIYDFSTLCLFTLGLGVMVRARWRWFALVFPLACLNKETAILLTLVFALRYGLAEDLLDRATFRRLLVYQIVVFVVIKAGVSAYFRGNPGSLLEIHLFDHNYQLLLSPSSLSTVALVFAVTVGVLYDWAHKPAFLKQALVIVPPLLALGLFFGYLDELRNYYEAYPIVLLLLAHSAWRAMGVDITSRAAGRA